MAKKATRASTRKKPAKTDPKKVTKSAAKAVGDVLPEEVGKLSDAPDSQDIGAEDVGDATALLGDDASPSAEAPPVEDVQVSPSDQETQAPPETESDSEEDKEPEDRLLAEFANAVAQYRGVMSLPIIREPQLVQGIGLHRVLTHLVLDHAREDLYDAYWTFHQEEGGFEGSSGQLMEERFALRGIQYIPEVIGERVSTIYTLFRSAIQGDKPAMDADRMIDLLDYGHQDIDVPKLLGWLEKRAK